MICNHTFRHPKTLAQGYLYLKPYNEEEIEQRDRNFICKLVGKGMKKNC